MQRDLPGNARDRQDADCLCGQYGNDFINETLVNYLPSLLEKYDVSERMLTQKTGMDKALVYRVLRGIRKPRRSQLLRIALALGCNLDETQKLLRLGERDGLRAYIKRDAVFLFCIERRLSLEDCERFLEKLQLEPLRV